MYVPIKAAADAGIKVVLVDTTLEQADFAVSQIASDNVGGGKAAAKALSEAIGSGGGKVHVNNTKPGISTTDQRAEGFQEEAKTLGLEFIGMDYNQDQPDKAAAITKGVLAKNPDLKGIFATNLFGAEGAATGLREAGKQDTVKIVGFDAGPKQVKDLEEGLAAGARRPEARRHRRAGRATGGRGAQGRGDQEADRHRLDDPHQGQPGREPGRGLQAVLLSRVRGARHGRAPRAAGRRPPGRAVGASGRRRPRRLGRPSGGRATASAAAAVAASVTSTSTRPARAAPTIDGPFATPAATASTVPVARSCSRDMPSRRSSCANGTGRPARSK